MKYKQETITALKSKNTWFYALFLGFGLFFINMFGITPILAYYDTDFIMDDLELMEKADEGYAQVCKMKSYGHTCIMKKEWNEMSIERSWVHFEIVGGNGCQYMVHADGSVYDYKELNNGSCGRYGHGTNLAVTTLIDGGDYWITERIERNPNFYDNYFDNVS